MAASLMLSGVSKSGSPTDRQITSPALRFQIARLLRHGDGGGGLHAGEGVGEEGHGRSFLKSRAGFRKRRNIERRRRAATGFAASARRVAGRGAQAVSNSPNRNDAELATSETIPARAGVSRAIQAISAASTTTTSASIVRIAGQYGNWP